MKQKPGICLSPYIKLRKEYFGGLVYDRRNGNILEVDKEAFRMLDLIREKIVDAGKLPEFLLENKLVKGPIQKIHEVLDK